MTLRLGTVVTVVAALSAPSATGWAQTRDHRRDEEVVKARRGNKGRAPLEVSGWGPQSGPVGTRVRIDGRGFSRKVEAIVGGRPARVVRTSGSYLEIEIPSRYGDGMIVLRHPDMARDLVVGRFAVATPPSIAGFSPSAGVPGTSIEIRGRGFEPGDAVFIGRAPLGITSLATTRIVARIPAGAVSDYLVLVKPDRTQYRSARRFEVTQPAPTIAAMAPASGAPGTIVKLSGDHFARTDQVFYGRQRVTLGRWAPTWIEVRVPDDARRDEYFVVRSTYGETRSPHRFELRYPPLIASFRPDYGPVGSRVEIRGSGFEAGDRLALGGRALRIVQLQPQRVVVEIPPGARSGVFTVERDGQRYASAQSFEVVRAPEIAGFSPAGGPPGAEVTITGRHFAPGTEVRFDGRRLQIVQQSEDRLVVALPRRARSSRFVIRNRGGIAESARAYEVYTLSSVTGIRPDAGVVGRRLEIYGRDFDGTERFWLGGVELPVDKRKRNKVYVTVPPGAQTGPIVWESHGQRQTSPYVFTVIAPPAFESFAPTRARPGAQVELVGDRFTGSTRVWWGSRELRVVERRLPARLLVELPGDARGSAPLYIEDAGMRIQGPRPLEVYAAVTIRDVRPRRAKPGGRAKIVGSGFEAGARVYWGQQPCEVLRVDRRGRSIKVRLPDATGSAYLWVDSGGERVSSPEQLVIEDKRSRRPRERVPARPGRRRY